MTCTVSQIRHHCTCWLDTHHLTHNTVGSHHIIYPVGKGEPGCLRAACTSGAKLAVLMAKSLISPTQCWAIPLTTLTADCRSPVCLALAAMFLTEWSAAPCEGTGTPNCCDRVSGLSSISGSDVLQKTLAMSAPRLHEFVLMAVSGGIGRVHCI